MDEGVLAELRCWDFVVQRPILLVDDCILYLYVAYALVYLSHHAFDPLDFYLVNFIIRLLSNVAAMYASVPRNLSAWRSRETLHGPLEARACLGRSLSYRRVQ